MTPDTGSAGASVLAGLPAASGDLAALYRDLHAHPELSGRSTAPRRRPRRGWSAQISR